MKYIADSEFAQYCKVIEQYSKNMDDYPYVCDLQNDLYYIVKRAEKRFSIKDHFFDHVEETHREFVHPEDYDMLMEEFEQLHQGLKDDHDMEYRWLSIDGHAVWIHCRGSILRDENDKPRYMIGCISEIGQLQFADNRTGLLEFFSLREMIPYNQNQFNSGYIMRIGMDDQESITIRFGVDTSTTIEHDLAQLIKDHLLPSQKLYKSGMGRFMIFDAASDDPAEAEECYERIRSALDRFIEKQMYKLVLTISAGVVRASDLEEITYEEILKKSVFALGCAIRNGKNQFYAFSREDYDKYYSERELLADMRKSIAGDFAGFELHYQPLVNQKTGKVYGAESLCRFRRNGEMISPVRFIPLLEESGLIIPVGKWIIEEAIKTCKEMQEILPGFRVTVNLSYIQILKSSVKDRILSTLEQYDLPGHNLVIELTESGYLSNSPSVRSVWRNLKTKGILLAIDDFGTGYSNLDNITKLEPDIIKIDRSFTMRAIYDTYSFILMGNLIRSFHNLGLKICVEGIETREELDHISTLAPDYIQGYYYSRPLPKDSFKEFLETQNQRP